MGSALILSMIIKIAMGTYGILDTMSTAAIGANQLRILFLNIRCRFFLFLYRAEKLHFPAVWTHKHIQFHRAGEQIGKVSDDQPEFTQLDLSSPLILHLPIAAQAL